MQLDLKVMINQNQYFPVYGRMIQIMVIENLSYLEVFYLASLQTLLA